MGFSLTIQVSRDRMVELGQDDEAIRVWIRDRLNDARNTFIMNMSRGPRPSLPGAYPRSDTGRLANSVDFAVGDLEGRLYTNVEYAAFLARGTVHMEPRRMLADAFDEVLDGRMHYDDLARAIVSVRRTS